MKNHEITIETALQRNSNEIKAESSIQSDRILQQVEKEIENHEKTIEASLQKTYVEIKSETALQVDKILQQNVSLSQIVKQLRVYLVAGLSLEAIIIIVLLLMRF